MMESRLMKYHCASCELQDVFSKIGFLVCEFANLEGRFAPALANMLGENGDQASAILGQVDSFSYKWQTLVGVAETLATTHPMASAVLGMRQDVKTVSAFRNKLAHSPSRLHPPELWLITNATTTKRGKPKAEMLTGDLVQAHLDTVRACMRAFDAVIDWKSLTSSKGLMSGFRLPSGEWIDHGERE